MSDGIWAKLSKCTKYYGKHGTPDIRGIMKYGCFTSLLWNNFVNYKFKMRVLTWRHYTRAARVVPAVISLPAKYARAEVMPIYQDPVFCASLVIGSITHSVRWQHILAPHVLASIIQSPWGGNTFQPLHSAWCSLYLYLNWQNVLGTHHASAHGGSSDLIVKMLD